jgi:hypothetical protein
MLNQAKLLRVFIFSKQIVCFFVLEVIDLSRPADLQRHRWFTLYILALTLSAGILTRTVLANTIALP